MEANTIAALIGAISGILITLIGNWYTRRQRETEAEENQATAAEQISSAWNRLIEPMEKRVAELERENCKLEARVGELEKEQEKRDLVIEGQRERIRELEDEVAELKRQIIEMGEKPRTRRKS